MSSTFGLTMLILCSFFVFTTSLELDDDSTRALIIRQFLEKYQPALLINPSLHRFRRFDLSNFELEPEDSPRVMKRNNAEVVNHILKNYGGLERLGDVGR